MANVAKSQVAATAPFDSTLRERFCPRSSLICLFDMDQHALNRSNVICFALSLTKGEYAMKSVRMSAAAALVFATATIATASSRSVAQHGAVGPGGMMGMSSPGMMGMAAPGMMGMMGPAMMAGAVRSAMCTAMADHIDGRLAYVKAELKITEAQEQLWNTYGVAARDNTSTMLARCTTMMSRYSGSTVNLPDQLDQNEQLMVAHLDAMRALSKALKPLYAALSDDQKKTADQLFWGPMGVM
jgi:LTXXQ motif family protein